MIKNKSVSPMNKQSLLCTLNRVSKYIFVCIDTCADRCVEIGDNKNKNKLNANQNSTFHNQRPSRFFLDSQKMSHNHVLRSAYMAGQFAAARKSSYLKHRRGPPISRAHFSERTSPVCCYHWGFPVIDLCLWCCFCLWAERPIIKLTGDVHMRGNHVRHVQVCSM